MLENSLLHHFIAVARHASFTRGADAVHTSRSAITRSIQRLEDQIGVLLFERTTRAVSLTAAGEALLREATMLTDRFSVAAENARRIGQGSRARLRISVCPSAASQIERIARSVKAFRQLWPDVDLELKGTLRGEQGQALRASEADLGIMLLNRRDCAELEWRVLASGAPVVWVPSSWDIRPKKIALRSLRDRPWVLPHPDVAPDLYEMQVNLCRSAGFEPIVAGFFEDGFSSHVLIACEIGAIFTEDWSLNVKGAPDLKQITDVTNYMHSELVIAWASGSSSAHITDFVKLMAADDAEAA